MSFSWKVVFGGAAALAGAWLLAPGHSKLVAEPGMEEIRVEVWRGAAMDAAIRAFEEESRMAHAADPARPRYRIITGQTAARDVSTDPTRFLLGVAGGSPPDLIDFDRYAMAEWAGRGAFQPLERFLAADEKADHPDRIRREDYYDAAWEEVTCRGPSGDRTNVFGIPNSVDNRALYYNKDLLKRAGYVDAKGEARPPRTWDELEEMAVRLAERDARGRLTRIGFSPNFGHTHLYLYGWMKGGRFLSPDGRRCTIDAREIEGALRWITRVYDRLGGAREVYGLESGFQGGAQDPFLQGQVAMLIDGFWRLDRMGAFAGSVQWGVAAPPVPATARDPELTPVSWMGGWCHAIPATAKNPGGAWAFVRFLSTWRARSLMTEAVRLEKAGRGQTFVPLQLANRKFNDALYERYVYSDPEIDPQLREAVRVVNGLLPRSRSRPVTRVGQLLWNEAVGATQRAIFHEATPEAALERARSVVQRALDHALAPPRGVPVNWRWIFAGYGALLLSLAGTAVLWDRTGPSWRGRGGVIMASPWILGFVLFTGGPILFSIVISFCDYDVLNPARYVGLANYREMFTADPLFWKSLGNTAYMLLGIPPGLALSLGLALLLHTNVRGLPVWRTAFYLPSIVPAVASSILWLWIFNPGAGLLNQALASIGIDGPDWLVDPATSKPALIVMGLWTCGGGMIVFLAGLQRIDRAHYEAAEIDGAGAWGTFRSVTLPLLTPYLLFNLVISLIATFQIFTSAYIMTGGGPVDSTLFYVYHLFNNAFRYLRMGQAAAMGWVLFLIVLGLTIAQLSFARRWVHHEGE